MNDKKSTKKYRIIEGNEPVFVYIGLAVAFIILLVLVSLVYSNIEEKIQLELKFDSEKSFNTVYMTLGDSVDKALRTMREERVSGVAIYSTSGRVYQSLGDAPEVLPIDKLLKAKQNGEDSTLGLFVFDENDRTIEYFRLSRLNIVFETGNINLGNGFAKRIADYPEIVYVKFDGQDYFQNMVKVRFSVLFAVLLIVMLFLLVINIYQSNRKFKSEIEKNKNLAHLGNAARTLTHEIKNPLSAMTIQSALMRKTLPSDYSQDLDVLDHEIERLTNLTNRVSEFLKNPVGNPEEIELVSFITDISKLFSVAIKLDFHELDEVWTVFDKDRARSVIENLIKNASESCTDRDPQVVVEMNLLRKKLIRIRVMDRGDGLSEDARKKLYNPFFTTKIHGSGIGLAITKQFVEAQGGSIKISSRDGGGTIAEIVLKRHLEEE